MYVCIYIYITYIHIYICIYGAPSPGPDSLAVGRSDPGALSSRSLKRLRYACLMHDCIRPLLCRTLATGCQITVLGGRSTGSSQKL